MGLDRVRLTRDGRDRLCRELEYLKGERRRQIARDLAEARSHGDLSENAEYDAAKEAQAMNEKKVAELEDTLIHAEIIDDSNMARDEALIGATVKVRDLKSGDEYTYMLVSEEESDFDENKISISSPVGKALLGHKVGGVVQVKVPAGVIEYEIVEITR
ncbi:MAG: transcription elongation factor GreA [Candidatus Omnitrophica bacterium]|nr:transcription elongation factor GreA [Candidatus Omnitrophota bacterium]MDD5488047.1 transcription elongation factor GreA [Candidatus Omnitrophota bacterium]